MEILGRTAAKITDVIPSFLPSDFLYNDADDISFILQDLGLQDFRVVVTHRDDRHYDPSIWRGKVQTIKNDRMVYDDDDA